MDASCAGGFVMVFRTFVLGFLKVLKVENFELRMQYRV